MSRPLTSVHEKRSSMKVGAVLGVLGWLAFAPSIAAASPVQLEWSAPAKCPTQQEIRAGVLGLVPTAEHRDPASTFIVRVAVTEKTDGTFDTNLHIAVDGSVSLRTFSGPTCESVARAVILIAALTLDGVQAAQGVSLLEVPLPPRPMRLRVGGQLAVDGGSLPAISGGAGVVLALDMPWLWLSGEALYWLPRLALQSSKDGRGGQIGLITGGLRACVPAWTQGAFSLAPCAGGELGQIRGTGISISRPHTSRGLWAAAWLGLAVRHGAKGGVFVELALDALVALRRPIFAIDGVGEVFQSQRLAGRLSLRVGFAFR